MDSVNNKLRLISDVALSMKGCQGVNSVTLFLSLSHSPAPLTQMESCGSLKDSMGVANSYPGVGRSSMALVHNGDVGGHRDRTSEACFPKQERKEVENGIPREAPSCRAEDGSKTQSQSQNETRNLSRSRSPSPENGFLLGCEDQDSEKDKDDNSLSPPQPHKKRGRRKLERPTKCESPTTIHLHTLTHTTSLFSFVPAEGEKNHGMSARC